LSDGQEKSVWLSYVGKVQPPGIDALLALCTTLAKDGVETVHLALSSSGGSVTPTIAAYNLLRGLPFRLTTHNVGSVDSMGNVLFLAGDERYASPHTSFMFHGVGFSVGNATRFEMKNLREKIDSVEADQRKIAGILRERTQLAPGQIEELFREAVTRDGRYALDHGIVHGIRDLVIPAGADVRHISLKD
jgi:ATP-dependent protease ClpP protease subunit